MNNQIDDETKVKIGELTINWCKINLGENKRKRTELKVNFSKKKKMVDKSILYGDYCFWRNKITIYLPNCEEIEDLIGTVIHEYSHYLQSRTKFFEYQKKYTYSTNPYEKEANRKEKKYTPICLNEIMLSFPTLQFLS
jgi:Zn-dependent peptidase ImmA (M78 family)